MKPSAKDRAERRIALTRSPSTRCPRITSAQSVGSRKVFVVRVDDGEATQLEQVPDGGYSFSLPGSVVSNVVTTTRTS